MVHNGTTIPILSIVMLAAIYGLQALIFIFRLRWDMIAWMVCEYTGGQTQWIKADLSSLYPGHSGLLVLFATVLVLEDGRL